MLEKKRRLINEKSYQNAIELNDEIEKEKAKIQDTLLKKN